MLGQGGVGGPLGTRIFQENSGYWGGVISKEKEKERKDGRKGDRKETEAAMKLPPVWQLS